MKIPRNAPVWMIENAIESEYGLLEYAFYPEKLDEHFYKFFCAFAKNLEDYLSVNPSFEKYSDRAIEIFAQQLPGRLNELMKEIVNEVELRTLSEFGKISRKEAKSIIDKAARESSIKKKERMNAPSSGRPKKNDRDVLREAVVREVKAVPRRLSPTLAWIAEKLELSSADALRKELKRHNLDWKELKKRT
ncbi:MAG TPA: hypothetical protein VF556_01880 [Pyrinomonadaceae bacterium]